jgi:hypothetical protein
MPLTLALPEVSDLPTIAETLDAGEAIISTPLPLPTEMPPMPNYGGEVLVVAVLITIGFMLIRAMMAILPTLLSIVVGIALLKYLLS